MGTKRPAFNELEMVNNTYVFANNYQSDEIYKIDVRDGSVKKIYDMNNLSNI